MTFQSAGVTFKMRSRSLKSKQLFPCSYVSLVKFQQLVQFVHHIISNLDGAMNLGHKQTGFDHHGFRKGL